MGGLISSLEDEHSNGRLDASLTTCGIVAGAVQLNNYQLDGEYAIDQLLNPTPGSVKLVNFGNNPGAGLASGYALDGLADQAQTTPQGRARLALAMSLMNVSTWAPGETMPAPFDFAGQEQEQFDIEFAPAGGTSPIQTTMDFVEFGRPYIEQADGGNASWNKGVNFARLLDESLVCARDHQPVPTCRAQPGRDLDELTRNANITAEPAAVRSLEQTSVPTGRLQVPELDMHTISDQLVPVQQENYYRDTVAFAGRSQLLRQAFVQRQLHCNFTPSELVAGVHAIQYRVDTGAGVDVATPFALNASAASLAGCGRRAASSRSSRRRCRATTARSTRSREGPGQHLTHVGDSRGTISGMPPLPAGRAVHLGVGRLGPGRVVRRRAGRPPGRRRPASVVVRSVAGRGRGLLTAGSWRCRWRGSRSAGSRSPTKQLRILGATWCLPLLLTAPLFSQDAYSYLAQGTLVHLGIDPYRHAPAVLANVGQAHVLGAVDPFWRHTTAPYGPLFLGIVSVVVAIAGSHLVLGVLLISVLGCWPARAARGLRPTARAGARRGPGTRDLVGAAQPARAARLGGRGAQRSFDDWFGGRRHHPRHRATAAAGHRAVRAGGDDQAAGRGRDPFILVAYGDRRTVVERGAGRRRRALCVVAVSVITGLGLGWISTTVFSTPDKVRLAITPATALGWTVAQLVPVGAHGLESALAVVAFGMSLVLGAVLLWRSRRQTMVRNLGIALIAVAVCGPAAWPWYLTWGLVLLGACPGSRTRARSRWRSSRACSWSRPTASWRSRCTPRRCSWSFTWRSR